MDSPEDNKPTQTIIAKEGSTVKNVIQAIIHLPAWAWIVGVIILSVALLLVSAVFNVEPLQGLLPTPTAFAVATEGQSLIIVADFEDRSDGKYEGIDPAQYVYEQLIAQTQKDNLDIRVERLRQVVDDNSAKPTGEIYNATMVVWGWYDALTITPRITRNKTLEGKISNQEGLRFSLVDPIKVMFSVVTDLPSQTSYLVMFILGMDNYSEQRYDEALIFFNNATSSVSLKTDLSTNTSEVYYFRGNTYYYQEEFNLAIENYNEAIRQNPRDDYAYFNRGYVYDIMQNYNLAIADYTKAIEINPKDASYYNNRGTLFLALEDYSRAIDDFNEAIEIDPEHAMAYGNRGSTYDKMGDFDLSMLDHNKAIELDPANAQLYNNRAITYSNNGNLDLALSDINKAIKLNPEDATFYYNRGGYYFDQSDYGNAIDNYNSAIELNSVYINAYFNRGVAYFLSYEDEFALADFNKVIELNPNLMTAYLYRGYTLTELDRTEDAIIDFEKILENSSDPELRQNAEDELEKLKGQ